MKSKLIYLALFPLVCLAQTQDTIYPIEEVLICATKYPQNSKNNGRIIAKITAEDLQNNPQKSVSQLLNEIAGVEINGSQSVSGKNQGIYILGGKPSHVLVIIDGVTVNDASGIEATFDLNLLTGKQIESIEVLHGASGTLYGSGAATAVIQIKTNDFTSKKSSFEIGTTLSTHRSQKDAVFSGSKWNQFVNWSGSKKDFSYLLSFQNQKSQGLSEAFSEDNSFKDNPFEQQNFLGKFKYKFQKNLSLQLTAGFTHYYHLFDTAAHTDSEVNQNHNQASNINLNSQWKHSKGQLQLITAFHQNNRLYRQLNDWTGIIENYNYIGNSFQTDVFHVLHITSKTDLLTGVNYQHFKTDNFTPYGNLTADIARFYSLDPYVTLNIKNIEGFNLSAGSRMNYHNIYGTYFTYSFNPSYVYEMNHDSYLKLLASWSSAYIAPSIYQLYSLYGNQSLTPETTNTFEIGTTFNQHNKIEMYVQYFERKEQNAFVFVNTDPVNWTYQYQNDKELTHYVSGIESGFTGKFNPMRIKTHYTYTEASAQRPYSIPQQKWNINIAAKLLKNSELQVSYQYVSNRSQMDFSSYPYPIKTLKNYHLTGLSWNTTFWQNKLQLHAAVDNVLNTDFVETIGYNTLGRNFALSVIYKN